MTHVAEEGNRREGGMTNAEIGQSILGAYRYAFALVPHGVVCSEESNIALLAIDRRST